MLICKYVNFDEKLPGWDAGGVATFAGVEGLTGSFGRVGGEPYVVSSGKKELNITYTIN